MKKNQRLNKFREWIQENFFTLIIFLVLLFLIILVVGLFIPINVSDFPTESIELERYNAGVERRTILIRSISSLISGVSVIIAFVSLIQSRNSEEKEKNAGYAFPAYAIPLENLQDASTSSSELNIKDVNNKVETVLQAQFDIGIKNIGLGSLVDYEIKEVYYEDEDGQKRKLDLLFTGNFILGKEETIRMVINIRIDFESAEAIEKDHLEQIKVLADFNDLLGHSYKQKFTIESDTRSLGPGEIEMSDGSYKEEIFIHLNQ